MNKSDLIKKISDRKDHYNQDDIYQTVNIIFSLIAKSLSNGDRVEIRNFGSFSVRFREQRVSRNPKTGTSVLINPKHHPYFRASKHLKESLNK